MYNCERSEVRVPKVSWQSAREATSTCMYRNRIINRRDHNIVNIFSFILNVSEAMFPILLSPLFVISTCSNDRPIGMTTQGRAISAPHIWRWTTGRRAVSAPDIWVSFANFFIFFELRKKINEAGNSLNAVEREPVPTRVLNPNASKASYKPKQRTYRTLCTVTSLSVDIEARQQGWPFTQHQKLDDSEEEAPREFCVTSVVLNKEVWPNVSHFELDKARWHHRLNRCIDRLRCVGVRLLL